MNREHPPCADCAKYVPATAVTGDCTDHDRPANVDDPSCVLFLARGSRSARLAARSPQELVTEIQRKQQSKTKETISRTSA